jgi:prephenate dehydrogenase
VVVGILGVGVIGGSVGLRARRGGARVLGADADAAALEDARAIGAIDEAVAAVELSGVCDVVVIAVHLDATLFELERLSASEGALPQLVIDVASVKQPVMRAAAGLHNFVATHPLAGSERGGVRAARADLFEGRPWAYVPTGDRELDERACRFIGSLGAIPLAIEAQEHDRAVALTSHVPQLVASCYAGLLRGSGDDPEPLYGPVARELLRISAMSFSMWRDILRANAANIEPQLRRLIWELEAVADALSRQDVESLREHFDSQRP